MYLLSLLRLRDLRPLLSRHRSLHPPNELLRHLPPQPNLLPKHRRSRNNQSEEQIILRADEHRKCHRRYAIDWTSNALPRQESLKVRDSKKNRGNRLNTPSRHLQDLVPTEWTFYHQLGSLKHLSQRVWGLQVPQSKQRRQHSSKPLTPPSLMKKWIINK